MASSRASVITLKDVARLAGVSEGTASLALNNRKGVNAETRQRVLEAARQSGYHPNRIARGLATRKTNTVGFSVTEIENPFFAALTRHINEFMRRAGYKLIVSMSNEDPAQEDEIIEEFIQERAEAVIVVPTLARRTSFAAFDALERNGIPYVFATAYYPGHDRDIDCVMTDLEEGAYQLTKYLLDLNHRKISFVTVADVEAVPTRDRVQGFRRAMAEYGVDQGRHLTIDSTRADYQSGYSAGRGLVNSGMADAIIALNDILALGVSTAVREGGYRVPEDVSVCGYDDVIFASIAEIPLTTVRQDVETIAREVVHLTTQRIKGVARPRAIIKLRPDLVIRRSTAPRKKGI
jgi:LacI family transcriptional regulator